MDYTLFVTPGLGDNSYVVMSGNEAALVDPQRDAWRFLADAESRKLAVRYVLETHVHNDYVTGALEVRSATGAEIAAPARGRYEFPHRGMADLPAALGRLPKDREVWTACASGHRASIAASLLDRAGIPVRLVAQGGVPEWLARCYPQHRAAAAG